MHKDEFIRSDELPSASVIRADYADQFPDMVQSMITRFSGKAMEEETPPVVLLPPLANSLTGIMQWPLVAALGIAFFLISPVLGAIALPVVWIGIVNGLRRAHAVISHHAVHNEVSTSRKANYWIQVAASCVSFAHSWEDYFESHVKGHHSRKVFTTPSDPDAALMLILGFIPGMTVKQLWRRLYINIWSPRMHWLFFMARVKTNLVSAPWHRRLCSCAFLAAVTSIPFYVPVHYFLIVIIVPLFPLYNVSALLQFTSEHGWLRSNVPVVDMDEYATRSWGRFFLAPLPNADMQGARRIFAWVTWSIKVFLVHVPIRYAVVVGDLSVHDYHHLHPSDHEWTKSIWYRQRSISRGDDKGMGAREFIGLSEALNEVFTGLSSIDDGLSSR